jgi:negative regulator of sigma E activity
MTCEHCQESISAFLDNELDETNAANIRTHLAVCAPCAKVCEDFAMILDFCQLEETADDTPPNSKALWCRINNLVENEIVEQNKPEELPKGWFARFWNNSWQFSFTQVASALLGIAVISSLLTIVGIKNYSQSAETANSVSAPPSLFERALGKLGLVETAQQARERRMHQQQLTIDYWRQRVETRRLQWNPQVRDTFDRNLNEINQVIAEYDRILQENPQDDISGEMLDSALNEQVELLREFSEL